MNFSPQSGARISKRKVAFALAGVALLITGVILAVSFAKQEYYDFYVIPRDEGDKILPQRWQDFAILACIWTVLAAWLWAGYYLLRRAFGRGGPNNIHSNTYV